MTTTLPPLALEFYEEVKNVKRKKPGQRPEPWDAFFLSEAVPAFTQSVQDHARNCAKCRSQSKVKVVRGKQVSNFDLQLVPAPEIVASLCSQGIHLLGTPSQQPGSGMANLVSDGIQDCCNRIRNAVASDRMSAETGGVWATLVQQHSSVSFENLRHMQVEAAKCVDFINSRQDILKMVRTMEDTLKIFRGYLPTVVEMHRQAVENFAVSDSRTFILTVEDYVSSVEREVEAYTTHVHQHVTAWEKQNHMPFEIEGRIFTSSFFEPLLPRVPEPEPKNRTSRSSASSASTATNKTGRQQSTSRVSGSRLNAGAPQTTRRVATIGNIEIEPTKTPYCYTISQPTSLVRPPEPSYFDITPVGNAARGPKKNAAGIKLTFLKPEGKANTDAISVIVRVRQLNKRELKNLDEEGIAVSDDGRRVETISGNRKTALQFDRVAGPSISQPQFWEMLEMQRLIGATMEGFASTVFAYGQTGSGKTFSLSGPEDVLGIQRGAQLSVSEPVPEVVRALINQIIDSHVTHHGIIPRVANELFEQIALKEAHDKNTRYQIHVSFVEIYNETLNDLLGESSSENQLKIREKPGNEVGFFIEGLSRRECLSKDQLLSAVVDGTKRRKVVSHQMNSQSSRSHSLLIIDVVHKVYDPAAKQLWIHEGKITLIDLAGSESVKKTMTSGQALIETAGINKSLLALSNAVMNLARGDSSGAGFVNWRDSKLTQILQDSLLGFGVTNMIACVSPSAEQLPESLSTLQFATKAANISKQQVAMLTPHEQEIRELKYQLESAKSEIARLLALVRRNGLDPDDD
eukprot:c13192_g1_i3.p1 GENE.c13192_g1_i3~~c13192_g1_i3.p1  ORF type:complete len:815 (+),score=175.66 c13192_g1_i3:40-2445(+)